ncbi:tol-pal system YbgF family protein [Streptomyces bauhiniae]|uniref:tol-pal system YbgF family protein n=1 Tax=Streptomyces bauhiniae TaxID=2340725 RepID=UPI0037D264BD
MPEAPYGPYQGFTVPPMPSGPPPAPPSASRAAAVALLNLSGLGLGYALLRRWGPLVLCLAATAVLLFVALPADADGLPAGVLVGYLVVLLLAAAHGARLGLRTPLSLRAPLALLLGLVLLAVPAGGALWYDGARAEAEQQALLGRLAKADDLVAAAGRYTFAASRADYRSALAVYRDLAVDHPGSRAADRVPARMRAYYSSVGAAYGRGEYCVAVEPLQFLRTVPRTMPADRLGPLTRWPDDRLATSLYECGKADLGDGGEAWVARFRELLADFPGSPAAAKVVPAVDSAVRTAQQGVAGNAPCTAVDRLHTLDTRLTDLAASGGDAATDLTAAAARAGRGGNAGAYECGVHQYKDGDFAGARKSMQSYVSDSESGGKRDRAKKIAIAAEVAQTLPAAGKKLPTTASGGSISVTVKNDSPHDITVLYTGPVTGSFTLKACGGCTAYSLAATITAGFKPCSDSGRNYPQRTIRLPTGTTYFVHQPQGTGAGAPASDTARIRSGYVYTECAYTTRTFGSGT